jgi:hypothetical protein
MSGDNERKEINKAQHEVWAKELLSGEVSFVE